MEFYGYCPDKRRVSSVRSKSGAFPGVGKAAEASLKQFGIHHVQDLAALDEKFLVRRFGKWGLALAGKARGEDAGGWFDAEVGGTDVPKWISPAHIRSRCFGRQEA